MAAHRLLGLGAGMMGLAAAGTAGFAHHRRGLSRRAAGRDVPFGTLRSTPLVVVADDGVPLHVEVDEVDHGGAGGAGRHRRAAKRPRGPEPTVVFVHGYGLNLDSWHFQRAAYRGLVRAVYYDQRSHGRSGSSHGENTTIDQLGADLRAVVEHAVPDGPVVLVGHSMGGMSVITLAEQHPELFGSKVVGTALISTTAGGLRPHRIMLPMLPRTMGGDLLQRAVAGLARGHRQVDLLRRAGSDVMEVVIDHLAFGDDVPESYVEFLHDMLGQTPFEVVADFFPNFSTLDKFSILEALGHVPTAIICGTADRITSVGHSRKLHAHIAGSSLLECAGAGHMVIMERPDEVNAELDTLITTAMEPRP